MPALKPRPDEAQPAPWPLWLWQRGRLLLLAAGVAALLALLALLLSLAQPRRFQAASAYHWRYIPPTAAMGNVFFPGSDPDTSAQRIHAAQADYCAFVQDYAARDSALGSSYGLECVFVGQGRLLLVTWGSDEAEASRLNALIGARVVQRTNTTLGSVFWVLPAAPTWVTTLPRPLLNALLVGAGGTVLAASLLLGLRLLAWPSWQVMRGE